MTDSISGDELLGQSIETLFTKSAEDVNMRVPKNKFPVKIQTSIILKREEVWLVFADFLVSESSGVFVLGHTMKYVGS